MDGSKGQNGEYLVFSLMDELFAFPTLQTIELVKNGKITFLPKMENFFCGVMNLRGDLLPTIDLRLMLNMAYLEDTKDTMFIIAKYIDQSTSYNCALRVDFVDAVVKIDEDREMNPPESGSLIPKKYLKGYFVYRSQAVLILNIAHLISREELKLLG